MSSVGSGPAGTNAQDKPANSEDPVSSDDEIDYTIKPEFYDQNLDDKDELWVHRQRKGRSSDAVLSCPACFTTLCSDCQRHDQYLTQYRAMFVVNCMIRTDQILKQQGRRLKQRKKKKRHSGISTQQEEDTTTSEDEVYHPVCCSVCSTEVGVLDTDQVYHFFNVVPSNS